MTTPSSSVLLSGGTNVYYDSGTGRYQCDVFSNPPDDTLTIAATSQNQPTECGTYTYSVTADVTPEAFEVNGHTLTVKPSLAA